MDTKESAKKVMMRLTDHAVQQTRDSSILLATSFFNWKVVVASAREGEEHATKLADLKQELEATKAVEVSYWRRKSEARFDAKAIFVHKVYYFFKLEHCLKAWKKYTHEEKFARKEAECARYFCSTSWWKNWKPRVVEVGDSSIFKEC